MKSKKVLVLSIVIALVIAFIPALSVNANAEVTVDNIEQLQEAISSATEATTIKLNGDIDMSTAVRTIDSSKNITLDLNGHTLTISYVYVYGTFEIKNGTVNATSSGFWVQANGNITIDESATVNAGYGIILKEVNSSTTPYCDNAKVVVNGTINGQTSAIWVLGNIKESTNAPTIQIGSKAVLTASASDGVAFAHQGYAKTTIANGAKLTGVTSAMEVRSGEVTINGGTFTETSTANPVEVIANGNGTTTEGAALAIAQHTTKQKINVVINGGTFAGTCPVFESNPQKNTTTNIVNASILNGTFKIANDGSASVYSEDLTGFIKGGTYDVAPEDKYLAEGYEVYNVNNKAVVDNVSTLQVSNLAVRLMAGDKTELGISGVDSKYLTITSADEKIAKITDGQVEGVAAGSTTISVASANGQNQDVIVTVAEVTKADNTEEDASAESVVNSIVADIVSGKEVNTLTVAQASAIEDAIAAGKELVVDVETAEIKKDAIKEDAAKVEAKVEDGTIIAGYFDIDLAIKDKDGNEITKLTNLSSKIKVTVNIPTVEAVKDGYTRKYAVVRVHDGVAEILEATLNEDGTLTFETDRFSTYAVTYIDTLAKKDDDTNKEETNKVDDNSTNSANEVTNETNEVSNEVSNEATDSANEETSNNNSITPKTGDTIVLFAILLVASAAGIVVNQKMRNKKNNLKK